MVTESIEPSALISLHSSDPQKWHKQDDVMLFKSPDAQGARTRFWTAALFRTCFRAFYVLSLIP